MKPGATQQIILVSARDAAGDPITTLTDSDFTGTYVRTDAATGASISFAPVSAGAAYTSGGIVHVANGEYQFHVPDAAWLPGATEVAFTIEAAGMVPFKSNYAIDDLIHKGESYRHTNTNSATDLDDVTITDTP